MDKKKKLKTLVKNGKKYINSKIYFNERMLSVTKEENFIVKRGIIQKNIRILNLYEPNETSLKYIKQEFKYLKGEINRFKIIVGYF